MELIVPGFCPGTVQPAELNPLFLTSCKWSARAIETNRKYKLILITMSIEPHRKDSATPTLFS
jgi:hypothetical protein